ncbi:RING-H2 finger protein ATL67-like [Hordeum vulgare]|uniref:RING-type E3 ubiquitin transferase n=1 Tax=Hordeum vulgare subsp. vulgare TaxID=112509 RepID=A0A8I6XZB4_HORVV|nr:RING-H2 finger protein ATL67-like [Hordeum vulgare subsp. vulgare]KAE8781497.1 RING-H2 finger protein ATL67-like [Hordeum vulgare]
MASGVSTSMVLTLLGFCVSVLFILFVCSRLVCALVRRRRRRSRASPLPPGFPPLAANYFFAVQVDRLGGQPAAGPGAGGLDLAAVASFPTRAFSAASPSSDSDSSDAAPQCVVCLAEYEDKDVLRTLPYCGHNFHMVCIDAWLKQHSTCPVCRISLSDYPDIKHIAPPLPSAVVIPIPIPPYSPEASISDPCHCLFVGTGHSPRPSEVLQSEPDQANRTVPGPSLDGPNNLTLSEVTSPGEITTKQ